MQTGARLQGIGTRLIVAGDARRQIGVSGVDLELELVESGIPEALPPRSSRVRVRRSCGMPLCSLCVGRSCLGPGRPIGRGEITRGEYRTAAENEEPRDAQRLMSRGSQS